MMIFTKILVTLLCVVLGVSVIKDIWTYLKLKQYWEVFIGVIILVFLICTLRTVIFFTVNF